ncbi:TBC1 domain family member 22B-like isoform X1 [Macrosteles quadrilineatus]|uniref:TBC1 domain family member 22B-like isoform X1 n=1 Tax=Macrosteles quadrilineatus TaxID=74068 RepID=UPI0023E1BC47|nr:TBC1 domain family member 22B-like isoform X1 [Macrosteles quadrilineatus]
MSIVRTKAMENHDGEDQGSTFWKKSTKPVPGRPSPRKEVRSNSQQNSSSTSFQDFQESVSDAWEIGDDEFCNILDMKISKQVVHSTALSVINSHRSKTSSSQQSSTECNSSGQPQPQNAKNGEIPETTTSEERKDSGTTHNSPTSRFNNTHRQHTKLKVAVGADSETMVGKVAKFRLLLESNLLNLEDLRHLSWSGIPVEVRPIAWRLLAGYLPASLERRQAVMERKRLDYWNLVKQYFDTERDETYQDTYRQIHIDIPRMSPLIALFQQKTVQEMFERILFIWAIRHPASGYVQGINDLVTPFYVVFLQEFLPEGGDLDTLEVNTLPKEHQDIIEADSFWCLSKFLDGIQDNYIFAQLGIQHKVKQLKELIQRIDGTLHKHLQRHGIDYLQFSFRWMNNLLTREIPLRCSIRLWDTYLAESDSFASFQLYVCAAFLLHWRQELLLERDFQGLMLMLQNLPTHNWTDADIGVLVAEAYRLKFTFADAPNHLQSSDNR